MSDAAAKNAARKSSDRQPDLGRHVNIIYGSCGFGVAPLLLLLYYMRCIVIIIIKNARAEKKRVLCLNHKD